MCTNCRADMDGPNCSISTVAPSVRKGQPPDRVAARALVLAMDPGLDEETRAGNLFRVAGGNRALLAMALARLERRRGDRPSAYAALACRTTRVALDRVGTNRAQPFGIARAPQLESVFAES